MMLASVRLLRVNTDSFIPGCKLEEGKRADREHEGERQRTAVACLVTSCVRGN